VTLAIDRAKLFQGEQMRRHEAEILREASAALNSSLELDKVLDNLLVYLGMVLPYDSACIFLHQNGSLRAVAGQGFPNLSAIIGKVFPGDNQLMQESIRLRAPLVLRNAQDDPRFSRWGGTNYVKAWMGVPLFGRGEMIGYMTLDSRQEGVFGQEQSALAMAFANTATAAIHNAQLHTEVQHLAMTDPLTGLYNLRALQEFGRREVERARRFNRPLSAILIDVDHFKIINDTYGHLIGNQVLSGLAKCCDENVRDVDIFARYGGEEFVLLLPETELEDARLVAERLRVLVAGTPLPTDGGPLSITISLGVSAGRGSTGNGKLKDIKELLEQADAALYIAKQSGRNRVSVNPESQHENGSRPAARQK
jgi:diguanylate cyclase (GGDEF)-like protein